MYTICTLYQIIILNISTLVVKDRQYKVGPIIQLINLITLTLKNISNLKQLCDYQHFTMALNAAYPNRIITDLFLHADSDDAFPQLLIINIGKWL